MAPLHLVLPFVASMLYVLGALFLKSASARGAGLWRTTIVTNAIIGVAFTVLWPLGGHLQEEPSAWVQPALVAGLFLAGQIFALVALQRGDVSVATPVMGLKVVMVAALVTAILGERVPPVVWAAAALSSAGIVLLGRGGGGGSGGTAPAIVFGALAAAAFALFDVLVQKWAPAWGAGRFLPVTMALVALFSLPLLALRPDPVPAAAWRPLLAGGLLVAVQGLLLISSLALYARATTINVVYSARGLWSVAAVWVLGPWFGNRERDRGAAVFRSRLAGAALLLGAIVLVTAAR
jgi:drug/metabolite transporter (DMT)-like permease